MTSASYETAIWGIDLVIKATAVLAGAGSVAWVLRKAAAARKATLWTGAMGIVLLLPLATWLMPRLRVGLLPAGLGLDRDGRAGRETPSDREIPGDGPSGGTELPYRPERASLPDGADAVPAVPARYVPEAPARLAAPEPESRQSPGGLAAIPAGRVVPGPLAEPEPPALETASESPAATSRPASDAGLRWPVWVLGIWALGAAGALASVAAGLAGLARIARDSRVVTDGPIAASFAEVAGRLGLRRPVCLLMPGRSRWSVPITWGVLRPRVYLPAEAQTWSQRRLELVVTHELAHVGRFDWPCQLAARLACCLYWFCPLAWVGLWRLRVESEAACDDAVLAAGSRPSEYAWHLLDLARGLRVRAPLAAAVVPMARSANVTRRLTDILDASRPRRGLGRLGASLAIGAAVALGGTLASLAPADGERPAQAVEAGAEVPADGKTKQDPQLVEAFSELLTETIAARIRETGTSPYGSTRIGFVADALVEARKRFPTAFAPPRARHTAAGVRKELAAAIQRVNNAADQLPAWLRLTADLPDRSDAEVKQLLVATRLWQQAAEMPIQSPRLRQALHSLVPFGSAGEIFGPYEARGRGGADRPDPVQRLSERYPELLATTLAAEAVRQGGRFDDAAHRKQFAAAWKTLSTAKAERIPEQAQAVFQALGRRETLAGAELEVAARLARAVVEDLSRAEDAPQAALDLDTLKATFAELAEAVQARQAHRADHAARRLDAATRALAAEVAGHDVASAACRRGRTAIGAIRQAVARGRWDRAATLVDQFAAAGPGLAQAILAAQADRQWLKLEAYQQLYERLLKQVRAQDPAAEKTVGQIATAVGRLAEMLEDNESARASAQRGLRALETIRAAIQRKQWGMAAMLVDRISAAEHGLARLIRAATAGQSPATPEGDESLSLDEALPGPVLQALPVLVANAVLAVGPENLGPDSAPADPAWAAKAINRLGRALIGADWTAEELAAFRAGKLDPASDRRVVEAAKAILADLPVALPDQVQWMLAVAESKKAEDRSVHLARRIVMGHLRSLVTSRPLADGQVRKQAGALADNLVQLQTELIAARKTLGPSHRRIQQLESRLQAGQLAVRMAMQARLKAEERTDQPGVLSRLHGRNEAPARTPEPEGHRTVTIEVDPDGKLQVGDTRYANAGDAAQAVAKTLQGAPGGRVILSFRSDVSFRDVMPIMDALQQAGLKDVRVQVRPDEN